MIQSLPKFISEKAKTLEEIGIDQGQAEVEIILCSILNIERLKLYLDGPELLTEDILTKFENILKRRATRYPLQYILEEAWFYGRKFFVSPSVMVPTPETEMLCESAIRFINLKKLNKPRLLDIGVGSGVISVTMANEIKDATVLSMDISEQALEVAQKNAKDLGSNGRIEFRVSNLFDNLKDNEKFDLILSNPPYISDDEYIDLPPEVLADPKVSLTSGDEGLDAIKEIICTAPIYLKPGGRIMFEIGYNQAERVQEITAEDSRYKSIVILRDLNDIDRVVILSCQE